MTISDEGFAAIQRAGWSIGDVLLETGDRTRVWLVTGASGENVIKTQAMSQADTWLMACAQAQAYGMLLRPPALKHRQFLQ